MDPIDLLRLAAQAAEAIRMAGDVEAGRAAGYRFHDRKPPRAGTDPPAVRT